ncbi:reverse transcriptase domain-containing protein [Stenotrophomonas sp. MMGLT7]|uniref:reverse transcriptase domain-containing protein n=1 Tax=Stenotrophomonas sp. MMGLT7 TaxID=2901227 RepID=UPI001E5E8DAA|nr:reverse transcriptase domain-containing protein [Stenotrophomonas sp. MMGLT7]MCD7096903.1 reverse transcriptase [Stenotrophomonas sp. MMGLT7]
MTTQRYRNGCTAGSQDRGNTAAWAPASAAWWVNFNNGNVNDNNLDNDGWALAVRPAGEFQGELEQVFHALYRAWQKARRRKAPSWGQMQFEAHLTDNLLALARQILAGSWEPRRSTSFMAIKPKAREIHAPDFADRVVHHWLIEQLEPVYAAVFIHDTYAGRRGKGVHAAVDRAQQFARQVASGQGDGWYLQLDIHNFFNTVPREILWALLKRRMLRAGMSRPAMQVAHALLRRSPLHAGVDYRGTPDQYALVPPHKRLKNAPPGRGMPSGNYSSQFLAEVLLNELDQFCKHQLKARRYLRFVDDFVLFHESREQLQAWLVEIEQFLHQKLQLRLKPDIRLRPLREGLDFLGYVVFPTHRLPRRRVVASARAALAAWEDTHVRSHAMHGTPADFRLIQARVNSYLGHLRHANAWRLQRSLHRRFGWLTAATFPRHFPLRAEGRRIKIRICKR